MTATGGTSTGEMRDVHRGGVPHGERRSVLTVPLVWLIRLYQQTFSRILGPVCRYYPSCSAYGVTALERHGLVRGTALTIWRVLRCNPWARGGVDHVPPRPDHGHAHDHGAGTLHTTPAVPDHEVTVPSTTPVSDAHRRD